jgi:hypothetical protein
MHKEYFAYVVCGILTLKCVMLPDWESTVALMFGCSIFAFSLWLDFKSVDNKSDGELSELKTEIKEVSSRLNSLHLKLGFKK